MNNDPSVSAITLLDQLVARAIRRASEGCESVYDPSCIGCDVERVDIADYCDPCVLQALVQEIERLRAALLSSDRAVHSMCACGMAPLTVCENCAIAEYQRLEREGEAEEPRATVLALKSAYIEGFNAARDTDGESAFEAWLHSAAKIDTGASECASDRAVHPEEGTRNLEDANTAATHGVYTEPMRMQWMPREDFWLFTDWLGDVYRIVPTAKRGEPLIILKISERA